MSGKHRTVAKTGFKCTISNFGKESAQKTLLLEEKNKVFYVIF